MVALMVVGGIVLVLVIYIIGVYNRLVTLKNRGDESWAQIDVQLKRRTDLIPNLVETVKGYATHEKETLENVIKARGMMQSAGSDPGKMAEADNMISGALKSLFAVTENYPQLKADKNFQMLQQELTGTEDRIAYARQFYNEAVRLFNEYKQQFPPIIFSNALGFKDKVFFVTEEEDKKPVKVKF